MASLKNPYPKYRLTDQEVTDLMAAVDIAIDRQRHDDPLRQRLLALRDLAGTVERVESVTVRYSLDGAIPYLVDAPEFHPLYPAL